LKNILKNINLFNPKELVAVEAIYVSESNWEFNFLTLKKTKNSISFENTKTGITSIDELIKILKPNTPVCLVVNGKGIINRKIAGQNSDAQEKLLQKIFPDAQVNDFYTEVFEVSENIILFSVARKNIIDNLVELLSKNKLFVVDIKIGPFYISNILPLLNQNDFILCNGFKLKTKNRVIYDFEISCEQEAEYVIGDSVISSKSLTAFAAGFEYLLNFKKDIFVDNPVVNSNKKEHYYANVFKTAGWGILIFFFAVLMLNYFLFDYFNKKQQSMSSRVSEYNFLLAKHDSLNNDLKQKRKFLEEAGLLSDSKISFYADRMVSEMPENIRLTELNIFPSKEKQQKNKEIDFSRNTILVAGNTQSGTYLNDWVKILKKYKWIEEVNIIGFNQESANSPAIFNLEIKIN
jgi:hypothetical protein